MPILKQSQKMDVQSCKPNDSDSYTEAYQKYTDCSYGHQAVCCYDDNFKNPFKFLEDEM